ncbi:hypothetical protein HJC23_001984 [Cyclotella cryptica]|uniref:Uncharacterized protein n=1 Tax=Cyclotella cryptica TaxID=29204 RepID=A0ABD3PQ39_9STRA
MAIESKEIALDVKKGFKCYAERSPLFQTPTKPLFCSATGSTVEATSLLLW